MMIFVNAVYKEDCMSLEQAEGFIKLLNPLCPHITEEIWQTVFNHENTIAYEKWPTYDESLMVDDSFEMVVQVNGKIRGKIEVSTDTSRDEMVKLAKEIDNVQAFIYGHDIVKEIVVPGKLVNIVVK